VDKKNKPLMPTTCSRAKRWIKNGKATGFWKHGIYCVRLNVEPLSRNKQMIVVGIDTGSKKEAFTIKSKTHTYLNIQSDAVTWVSENLEVKKNLRRTRRYRQTPCRQPRFNRNVNRVGLSPSTKARWQCKLRIINRLMKLFPITNFIIENVTAKKTKGKSQRNQIFSQLEYGKNWFYAQLQKIGTIKVQAGWRTKQLRDKLGLEKSKNKMSGAFESHCIDSWTLANSIVGGHTKPDNKSILYVQPIRFNRRRLHVQNPTKGGIRRPYGGTLSSGLKRGSLAIHKKYGLILIGGASKMGITLHDKMNNKRICRRAKKADIKFLTYNSFLNNN
jgi:hypothetical protein